MTDIIWTTRYASPGLVHVTTVSWYHSRAADKMAIAGIVTTVIICRTGHVFGNRNCNNVTTQIGTKWIAMFPLDTVSADSLWMYQYRSVLREFYIIQKLAI